MAKKITNKAVKGPAGAAPAIIIHQIETRPVHRTEQNIPKWRQAIQSAESTTPRRILLYTLYADVVQDGHVIAVKGKRIDAATTANWQFVDKEGKPVDEINELIDSTGFDDLITEIMESKFWGYSIMEPTFWKDHDDKWEMSANLLPRFNYRPEKGIVAFQQMGEDGINIREGIYAKTVMEVGQTKDLGLLLSAAQYAILKRGGVGDWAMFVQVFGRPIIDATWDGFDEGQRVKLQKSLDIGPGGVIVRPEGTTVNLLDGASGQSNVHGDFYKAMNKEISKALLGTTETTESSDSSGYAQAETHGEQDDNKHESDLSFVRKVLNSRFTRVLQSAGFNVKGGSFVIQGDEVRLDKAQAFEIHKSMVMDINLPLDHDFFYEEYGLPKPENYEQIIKDRKALSNVVEKHKTEEDVGRKTKENETDKVELSWYQKLFTKLFPTAPAVTTGATTGHHHTINLAFEDTFDNDGLIQRVWDANGKLEFDFEVYEHTVKTLLKGFKKGWDDHFIGLQFAPGFTYGADDPALLTAFEQNLFRFSGAKTLAELHALNQAFKEITSFNDFKRRANIIAGKYNENWLLTEYNTAILVGQSASTYNRLKAQAKIFPYWQYKTAGDELVRHSHSLLEGIILPANDPRWDKIFPPNGWNCRCYIVPLLRSQVDPSKLEEMRAKADKYIDSPAFENETRRGFGINRGLANEVFTENQQYTHRSNLSNKKINELQPANFKLPEYDEAKKVATVEMPVYKKQAQQWYDDLEQTEDLSIIRDHYNRPLIVEKDNFKIHINKKDDRVSILKAVEDTLTQPDEVWLTGFRLEDIYYIKYFKNKTMVAVGEIKNGKLKLSTWFTLAEKESVIKDYRRGLLVYSKK